jgi:hypothetical protein
MTEDTHEKSRGSLHPGGITCGIQVMKPFKARIKVDYIIFKDSFRTAQ